MAPPSKATVMKFLQNTVGRGLISGQYIETGTHGWAAIETVKNMTGKYVGMIGGSYWWFTQTDTNPDLSVNQYLINYVNAGGIVTLCTWMPNPSTNGMCMDTSWLDANGLLTPGTATNNKFVAMVDGIGYGLKQLRDAGVTVIFRPYHENPGAWFWWGAGGSAKLSNDQFKEMWRWTHDRITHHWGCDNIIWWFAGNAGLVNEYNNPGDAYIDIIGVDIYSDNPVGYTQQNYDRATQQHSNKLLGYGEFGSGSPQVANESFDERKLINDLKARHPKVVMFQQWWSGGPPYNWGIQHMQHSWEALNDPWVLNRDEVKAGLANANSGGNPDPPVDPPEEGDYLTPGSGGSVKDAAGDTWTLPISGDATRNGQAVPGGGGTSALTSVDGVIWAQDKNSKGWYIYQNNTWVGQGNNTPPVTPDPPVDPDAPTQDSIIEKLGQLNEDVTNTINEVIEDILALDVNVAAMKASKK
jgi:hypothetical protein